MSDNRVGVNIGADDSELADFFWVTETTINNWKHAHIDFFEPIKKGKESCFKADWSVEKVSPPASMISNRFEVRASRPPYELKKIYGYKNFLHYTINYLKKPFLAT